MNMMSRNDRNNILWRVVGQAMDDSMLSCDKGLLKMSIVQREEFHLISNPNNGRFIRKAGR